MAYPRSRPRSSLPCLALLGAALLLAGAALAEDAPQPASEPQAADEQATVEQPAAQEAAEAEAAEAEATESGAEAGAEAAEAEAEEEATAGAISPAVARRLAQVLDDIENDRLDDALASIDGLATAWRRKSPIEVAQIHRFRGYVLLMKGDSEAAAAEFEIALAPKALDPVGQQQTTYSLAQIYTQLGKNEKALALIEQWFAESEEPTPDAYFLKALILFQQKNFKLAVGPAKQAVESADPPRESWVQLLVAIHTELEDWPNVAATLERLIAINPLKKQYWVQLAAVRNHMRQDGKALATMRLANRAELLKEDRELRQLTRLLFARELPYECAHEIEGAIASGGVKGDADAYRMLSNCWIAAREPDRALEPLAKAGELAEDGEMYVLLAQIHLQREHFEPAIAALEKALAKSKPEKRASVQLMMGVALLGSNRLDEAERAFRAASSDPKVGDAAKSYLKVVEEQRTREQQGAPPPQPGDLAQR
jgi:tetratricopeptide (TPR) repeat protein